MNEWTGRYKPIRTAYWWRIKTGDGERLIGKFYTENAAQRMAQELLTAFMDGKFVGERSGLGKATSEGEN